MSRGRLLVVDDDVENREVLAEVLLAEGYGVVTAGDAADAMLRLSDGETPCLILLDVHMRGVDGPGLLAQLRVDARLSKIPVLLVSGMKPRVELPDGAIGWIRKPLDLPILLARVAEHCGEPGATDHTDPDARVSPPAPESA